jgi:hypothetical protein
LEFAILTLQGLKPNLVATARHIKRQLDKGHYFLEVPMVEDYLYKLYVADPTWDFVTRKSGLVKTLYDKGSETVFHQEYELVNPYLKYSD